MKILRVLNRHKLQPQDQGVYCGRSTPWGNYVDPERYVERGQRVDQHRREVEADPPLIEYATRHLRGYHLMCSCSPARCHCDNWLRLVNWKTATMREIFRDRHGVRLVAGNAQPGHQYGVLLPDKNLGFTFAPAAQPGMTSELLVKILADRHECLNYATPDPRHEQILAHLRAAEALMKEVEKPKKEKKHATPPSDPGAGPVPTQS